MDRVNELLQLAGVHFRLWQQAVEARTQRYRDWAAAAAVHARDEEDIIRRRRRSAEVEERQAAVHVWMIQHCERAADYVAKRLLNVGSD